MEYNYNSWLNDEILLNNQPAATISNGLDFLARHGALPENDLKKIRESQKEGFNRAVEMTFKSKVKIFNEDLKNTENPQDLYKYSIDQQNDILEKEKNELLKIIAGTKNITITGSQYKKIMSDYSKFESGTLKISTYSYNRNMILTAIYKFIEWLKNNNPDNRKGFNCKLHPDTVKEIYYFMEKEFIKGDLQDFQAIFSNSSNTVTKPIQWLILIERGKYKDRGNQTALNVFLKLMLGTLSNPDRRKAKDLFIDKQGYFINKSLLKPDKDKILTYEFETGLNEIIKKADH